MPPEDHDRRLFLSASVSLQLHRPIVEWASVFYPIDPKSDIHSIENLQIELVVLICLSRSYIAAQLNNPSLGEPHQFDCKFGILPLPVDDGTWHIFAVNSLLWLLKKEFRYSKILLQSIFQPFSMKEFIIKKQYKIILSI
jgi:hypothetical protein